MTRQNVWSSCNRVVDSKWQDAQHQSHLARLESIHALSGLGLGVGMGGNGPPPLASHKKPLATTSSSSSFKALPRSKSPAAKSRQAEIERENLKMIKKIVELQTKKIPKQSQNTSSSTPSTATHNSKRRVRPASAGASRTSRPSVQQQQEDQDDQDDLLPDGPLAPASGLSVPRAASHALYTHRSATMTHHFPDQNDVAWNFVPGSHAPATRSSSSSRHQIVDENRKLLQRILSSKTSFSRATWQAQERERRKLLGNISRFSHRHNQQQQKNSGSTKPVRGGGGRRPGTAAAAAKATEEAGDGSVLARAFSHHTLAVVDSDGARIIRTGSPVTHLRHRSIGGRPQSASPSTQSRSLASQQLASSYGQDGEAAADPETQETQDHDHGSGSVGRAMQRLHLSDRTAA